MGLFIQFEEDPYNRLFRSSDVRAALKEKKDGESLLATVEMIAQGFPQGRTSAIACTVPTHVQSLLTANPPKQLVDRYGAAHWLAEYDYSECPYKCKACNRKAIAMILNRDGRRCQGCGKKDALSIHHIKPRNEDGTNAQENLITLCSVCHDCVEVSEEKPRTLDTVLRIARRRLQLVFLLIAPTALFWASCAPVVLA